MEVISSKSFEEDISSSGEKNVQINQPNNVNNNNDNILTINEEEEINDNNENPSEEEYNEDFDINFNEMELNRINEINDLDEEDMEIADNFDNEMNYENEISNSVKNVENNTINTIDEDNDGPEDNSLEYKDNIPINILNEININDNILDDFKNTQIPFIRLKNEQFEICDEAKFFLNNNIGNNKIGILCLFGEFNSKNNKLNIINKILSNDSELKLLNKSYENEEGILIYTKHIMIHNNFSKEEFPCIIIDIINYDSKDYNYLPYLFLIIAFLSSILVFNSIGDVNDKSFGYLSNALSLIKTIKLSEDEKDQNISDYFPILLWVIQNSNLILEDKNGNTITEKQYLESLLTLSKGNSDDIEEINKTKNIIKNYFKERMCLLLNNANSFMGKNEEQIEKLKNKILKKMKPKSFYNNLLTGNMLIDFAESIIDNINNGISPTIENIWKYLMKNQIKKYSNDLILKFINELKKYRNENINNDIFFDKSHIIEYKNKILKKYLEEFMTNNNIDDETKVEFSEKIKYRLENELKKYQKENEKYFEDKFMKDLNILSNKFMEIFSSADIYETSSFKFFEDFEKFRDEAMKLVPDFPKKNEILFEKIFLIIKKYINGKIMKIKVINEEKNYLQEEIKKNDKKIDELEQVLNEYKEKNKYNVIILNNNIQSEKKRYKKLEEKLNDIINEKEKRIENFRKDKEAELDNYEYTIKDLSNLNIEIDLELKGNNEQLISMKMNNDKIATSYEQKIKLLEKEILNWKDKYSSIIRETLNKEKDLKKENRYLKEEYKFLMKKNKEKSNKSKNTDIQNNLFNNHPENKNISQKNKITKMTFKNMLKYIKVDIKDKYNKRPDNNSATNEKKDSVKYDKSRARLISNRIILNNTNYKEDINNTRNKIINITDYIDYHNTSSKSPVNINNSNNKIEKNHTKQKAYSNNMISHKIYFSEKNDTNNESNNDTRPRHTIEKHYINSNSFNTSANRNKNCTVLNITKNNQEPFISVSGFSANNSNHRNLNRYLNNTFTQKLIEVSRNSENYQNEKLKKINNLSINNFYFDNSSNKYVENNKYKNSQIFNSYSRPEFDPKKLKINISKSRIRKDKNDKPYLEYVINLNYDKKQSWVISRRFTEFLDLFKSLKKIENKYQILPQACNIFTNVGSLFAGLSQENKILKLERFLKELTETDWVLNYDNYLYSFLDLKHALDY